ncbi:outer membrane beta-barrel protein [Campylobacter sp. MIT 12-8780]|nr:outer membrane beta-barrel protein [Campylobacter sp. MIT 12-8780]NDJ27196.1 outer membrane beta-barrel protein [Campylobacter sp. MIT 19-121]
MFCFLLAFTKALFAEESGIILGAGMSAGFIKTNGEITSSSSATMSNSSASGSTLGLGFLAGYKYFITPKFGLRAYADIEAKISSKKNEASPSASLILANSSYGAYVDMLYNFIDSKRSSHGLFAGLGFVNTKWSKDIMAVEIRNSSYFLTQTYGKSASESGLVGNIGYRFYSQTNNGSGSSFEFGVKVPFSTSKADIDTPYGSFSVEAKQQFDFFVRYIYSF